MAEIVLDRVTKSYPDGAMAVQELSLTIAEGEFIILVGPSGCGKSTTLNMIAGLEDISSGELRIGGERVNEKAPKDRDIAMVFQSYALYPHMTVRQNIAFPLTLAKMKKAEITEKVEDTARILDLTDVLDRKPAQLSGGQRQRVAMGRAIVRHPKAFLMDEPLSNLDAKLRVQMRGEIARLQRRLGATTVYVTHDQTEAMTLGDRVVVMRGGVVQQIGTPDELYERPANLFVAGFIGSPAMNFFPAGLTETGLSLAFGEITLTQPVLDLLAANSAPKDVIVGVRPEHLHDAALIDAYQRISSLSFEVNVDLVESLGADKYVYFTAEGPVAHSDQLSELDDETGGPEHEFVARVPAASKAVKGKKLELAFDTSQLAVFDPDSGAESDGRPCARGAVTQPLVQVRAHLDAHFGRTDPDVASVTFLGTESLDVLRYHPHADGVVHYVSLGCSRHPMVDPTAVFADPERGPRAEVVLRLRDPGAITGLARSLAIVAASPAVEGVVLRTDALVDLGTPLWARSSGRAPFTAVLLGDGDIADLPLEPPRDPVRFLSATPITATEAAWVRLKGADAMRTAWRSDGVDVLDPNRRAAQPH